MLETMIKMVPLYFVQGLPVMELADEYPTIAGDESIDLIASVEANGIREPLILFDQTLEGKEPELLDGRNRLAAALKVGLEEIPVRYFTGTIEEAEDLIIDLNEKRRHLLPVQRAYIADKHRAIVAKRAQERMLAGKKVLESEDPVPEEGTGAQGSTDQESGRTREILAKKHNAGKNAIDTVQRIRRVAEETMPDPDQEGEVRTPRAIKALSTLEKMKKGKISIVDATKSVFGDPGQEIAPDDPLAKWRLQFNNADTKWHESARELLDGGRPEDRENVRIKAIVLHEEFENIDEVELQSQHHFLTEREPSDDESRWAGEVRIRLVGIDKMIIERNVLPSSVTRNVEFLDVINRMREFFDGVEKSLDDNS